MQDQNQKILKFQQRKEKISSIRQSLGKLNIFNKRLAQFSPKLSPQNKQKHRQRIVSEELDPNYSSNEQDRFQSKLLSIFTDKYEIGDKIGEGAHGLVKKCYNKQTRAQFAVKTMKLERQEVLFLKKNFMDIKNLCHDHIIKYKALFLEMNNKQCHLVMEYLPFPNLLQIKIQTETQLKQIIYQIVSTLAYLHSHKICHRDIKPENILFDQLNKKIKIIDFGISKQLVSHGINRYMLTQTGTLYYRAPETFEGGGYDEMVDIWALGVTMFRLMTGYTPFQSKYCHQTISKIMKGQFRFSIEDTAKYSRFARNFASKLLKKRLERPNAKQALFNIWFRDIYQNRGDLNLKVLNYALSNFMPQQQISRQLWIQQNSMIYCCSSINQPLVNPQSVQN